ncbi:MurR/RpiR family transcriptional regulator [Isoptericola sp. S6320L]|nr:MurR/RpiR family transcriptional regulator [Isoptericola sp. S6320L]
MGRATVVRAAQTLGYEGYPQLRVAAARELALRTTADAPADGTMLGVLRESVARFAARLGHTVSGLTEEVLQEFVAALDDAGRVLVVANGLSSPLGLDLVLRLTSAGRPAELLQDALAQRIAARQLGPDAVCLVVSGSGTNDATLAVMRAAHDGGTPVLAITSFAQSPVAQLADTVLVVPPVNDSFRDELVRTSRAALMLVTEALVEALVARRGDRGRETPGPSRWTSSARRSRSSRRGPRGGCRTWVDRASAPCYSAGSTTVSPRPTATSFMRRSCVTTVMPSEASNVAVPRWMASSERRCCPVLIVEAARTTSSSMSISHSVDSTGTLSARESRSRWRTRDISTCRSLDE